MEVIEAIIQAQNGQVLCAAAQAGRAEELSMLLQAATDVDWANGVSWAALCSLLLALLLPVALKPGTACACRRGRQRCGLHLVRAMHPAWGFCWALVLQWTKLIGWVAGVAACDGSPPPLTLGWPPA